MKHYEEIKAVNKKMKETLSEKDMKHAQEMVLDKQLSETLKLVVRDSMKRQLG